MPQPYNGSLTGINARQQVTITEMLGTDVRNAASVYTPLRELANLLQYLMQRAGIIDLAQTWTANQTIAAAAGLVLAGGQNGDIAIALTRAGVQAIRKEGGILRIGTADNNDLEFYRQNEILMALRSIALGVDVGVNLNVSGTVRALNGIHAIQVGDDAYIDDCNLANHFAVRGYQNPDTGGIVFGNGGHAWVRTHDGQELSLAAGDTSRLVISATPGVSTWHNNLRAAGVGAPQAAGDAVNLGHLSAELDKVVRGENATGTTNIETTGPNAVTKSGFYRSNGHADWPGIGYLIHLAHPGGNWHTQIGFPYADGGTRMFIRSRNGNTGTWGAQQEVALQEWVNTQIATLPADQSANIEWSAAGGWSNPNGQTRLRKSADGLVVLTLGAERSSAGTGVIIATLPVGYRPSIASFAWAVNTTTGTAYPINVRSDGTVRLDVNIPTGAVAQLRGSVAFFAEG